MNTTKMLLKKCAPVILSVAGCSLLTSCDSNLDLSHGDESNFILDDRYNKNVLEADSAAVADFPAALLSGEVVKTDGTSDDVALDITANSAGQFIIDNFRYFFNSGSSEFRDVESTRKDLAVIVRSATHEIVKADFEEAIASIQSSSNGIGSLREALLTDGGVTDNNFVNFSDEEVRIILNAIRSLGYTAEIDEATKRFIVLSSQTYSLESTSTNQLLLDEQKITGTVEVTRVWQTLSFRPRSGEYTVIINNGGYTDIETGGTFEVQLNTL